MIIKNFRILNEGFNGNGETIKVSNENEEIGFFIYSKLFSKNQSLFITHLEIYDEFRNKGLFKILLENIINFAKSKSFNKIILEPDITKGKSNFNFLVSLYKKYGFTEDPNDQTLLSKDI